MTSQFKVSNYDKVRDVVEAIYFAKCELRLELSRSERREREDFIGEAEQFIENISQIKSETQAGIEKKQDETVLENWMDYMFEDDGLRDKYETTK